MLESTYTDGAIVFEMKMVDPTHVSVVVASDTRYPVTYHIGQLESGTPIGDCAAQLRKAWKDSGQRWDDWVRTCSIASQQAINRKLWAKENGRMHSVDANRLIAEFMGYEVKHNKCYSPKYNDGTIAPMQFHTSWDWLMPVVQKIGDENLLSIHMDVVYDHVVEFIKECNDD